MQNKNRLLTIGEAAKSLGITRRIILNYEDKGLLQADQKDGATGNRYYTIDTVSRIRSIRTLQNLGLSLDDIYHYYNGTTELEPLILKMEKLRDELNLNIEKLKERLKTDNDFEIRLVTLPAQTIYCKAMCADSVAEKKEHLRDIVTVALRKYGSDSGKCMFFIEYSLDAPERISYCAAVSSDAQGDDIVHLPAEKALCIFYHGSYESIPMVRDKLLAYAKENKLSPKGTCRHIYLEGPPQHNDPTKFITQVAILLKED